jgi:hypothetical protein
MPPAPVSPDRLLALGAALGPLRECAREGAEEVLGHVPDAGDRETQDALDGYLDLVADLLRGIDGSAGDLADRFRVAALSAEATEHDVTRRVEQGSSATRGAWP